jgi:hypothetical protein
LTPPKDHTCEWRDAASALHERVAKLEATIAKLESARMRPHRSEKRPKLKLPPLVPPAPPAEAPRPNDDIRHAVLETEVEKIAVPEAKRTAGSQAHGATLSSFSQAHGATPFAA